MQILEVLFTTIGEMLLLVPKLLLAVFPLYNTLSGFKQNLIAAALVVSPIVIWLAFKAFKAIRCFLEAK